MERFFNILELPPGANATEIKKAYRRLARIYHPDVNKDPDAEEKFIAISEAYQALTQKQVFTLVTFDYEPYVMDAEEQRKERARNYARQRYEQFKKNNIAFQNTWYFMPVKIFTRILIFGLYGIALLMFLAPFLAWAMSAEAIKIIAFSMFVFISSHVFRLAREIDKGTQSYFKKWDEL